MRDVRGFSYGIVIGTSTCVFCSLMKVREEEVDGVRSAILDGGIFRDLLEKEAEDYRFFHFRISKNIQNGVYRIGRLIRLYE
jgi:hypothetical protein